MEEKRYNTLITFEEFSKHIDKIKKITELRDKVDSLFSEYARDEKTIAEMYFPTLDAESAELLAIVSGDNDGWIDYWIWELNCGADWTKGCVTDKEGNDIKLETVKDLWNAIKWDNEQFKNKAD